MNEQEEDSESERPKKRKKLRKRPHQPISAIKKRESQHLNWKPISWWISQDFVGKMT